MFDKWLKLPAHHYLHLTALSILMVGLSLSNVLMSIGSIWIIANWLIEMDFKTKWNRLKKNKTLIAILLFLFWSALSLFWSADWSYAAHDLKIKLPLLAIPLVIGTTESPNRKENQFLLFLFLGVLLFTTSWNYIRFNRMPFINIREMSFFISHVRLSILIVIAVFLGGYAASKKLIKWWIYLPLALWFVFYLYKSQTLSGYLIFASVAVVTVFYWLRLHWLKWVFLVGFLSLGGFILFQMNQWVNDIKTPDDISTKDLNWYTPHGHSYYHDTLSDLKENGRYVWRYICVEEAKKEWNSRSAFKYDSLDKKQQPVYGTLFRYMTSKGIKKDSAGIWMLSDQDVKNIENGQTNVIVNKGLKDRFDELYIEIYTYSAGGDPNGHSLIQRMEHFKTACHIVKNNPWFGVGIGDIQQAFLDQYQTDKSLLSIENQHRSHNQFLSSWIAVGLPGFLLLIFILFYPFFNKPISYTVILGFIVFFMAFLSQDVIETQAGITIFSLFYSLFNYYKPWPE